MKNEFRNFDERLRHANELRLMAFWFESPELHERASDVLHELQEVAAPGASSSDDASEVST